MLRKRFFDALRSLAESRLFLHLGYPTIHAYTDAVFSIGKSSTYKMIATSEALDALPAITASFESGALSWSLTAELARVASSETEEEWLALAETLPVREVQAAIRDALKRKSDRPRRGDGGLPGAPVDVRLRLEPAELAVGRRRSRRGAPR